MKNYSFLGTTILRVLKSQLLLFAMLLCCVIEAKGETVFSFSLKNTDVNDNALVTQTISATGGSIYSYFTTADQVSTASNPGIKMDGAYTSSNGGKNYVLVTLNTPLQTGDKITLVFSQNGTNNAATSDKTFGINVSNEKGGSTIFTNRIQDGGKLIEKTFTTVISGALIGSNTICLTRADQSIYLHGISVTRESGDCSTFSFRYRNLGGTWYTLACFNTQKNGTDYITDEVELPLADHFYVGWGDDFSSTHSLDNEIQYMYAGIPGQSNNYQFGNAWFVGNVAGAKGYFHIYTDSGEKNKAIRFVPSGYTLQFGSGNDWVNDQTLVFTPTSADIYATTWETELTQLTSSMISKQVWVGYQTSTSYVWCPKSQKVNLNGLRISNSETVNASYADTYGKFMMYANSGDMNFYCTFVPYYVVELYDQDVLFGSRQSSPKSSAGKIVFEEPAPRAGYTFSGWKRNDDSYTVTSAMSDWTNYTMWTPYERFNA